MGSEDVVGKVIKSIDRLPTLPGVAIKILEAVQDKNSGLKELADILSTDPPLSAEVLRLINSPYYGLNSRITSVTHAVNLLGATTVKNLALSFSVIKCFQSDNAGPGEQVQEATARDPVAKGREQRLAYAPGSRPHTRVGRSDPASRPSASRDFHALLLDFM